MATPLEQIQALNAAHKVVIYSKTTCPYCDNAKRAFAGDYFASFKKKIVSVSPSLTPLPALPSPPPPAINVVPHVLELDQLPNTSAWQSALGGLTGATSVPRVFINNVFLGGGDDTVAAQRSGKLAQLCAAK